MPLLKANRKEEREERQQVLPASSRATEPGMALLALFPKHFVSLFEKQAKVISTTKKKKKSLLKSHYRQSSCKQDAPKG